MNIKLTEETMNKYSVNLQIHSSLLLSEAVVLQGIDNQTMYSNKMNVNQVNIQRIKIMFQRGTPCCKIC